MPSPFKALKQNPHKPGSLMYDLWDTKKDIRKTKKGEQGEASLDEMRQTKKRIKREIKEAENEERSAAAREAMRNMKPRQLSPVYTKMQHSFL
jgi:septal ring factor EnvC (AmiA/AmiB activator)